MDTGEAVELPALSADGSPLWIELRLSSVPTEGEAASNDGRHVIAIIRDITARKVAETATMIARQADLIVELGRDFGQLAVIEQGAVPTQPTDVSVLAVVSSAIESTAHMSTSIVEVEIPAGLQVHADVSHVTRIVSNLISNAMKYGHPPIRVAAEEIGEGVEVRVSDHGPGIPILFASQLFDKFTRAESGGVGLGLGLAIAKGLAVANGGDLWYEPNEPTGATFTVRLPAAVR